MKAAVLVAMLCLAISAVAAEPLKPPIDSQALLTFLEQAKEIAIQKIEGLTKVDLVRGCLTPYYASRTSGRPAGTLVSFTVKGSQRKEKLGEMEDRVIVIFQDGKDPEVKKIAVWLNEGIIGATR